MDFKKTDAPLETVTYDRNIVDAQTDNIYEAISIISKRKWIIIQVLKLRPQKYATAPTEKCKNVNWSNRYFPIIS